MKRSRVFVLFEVSPTSRDKERYTRTISNDLDIFFLDLSEFVDRGKSSSYRDHSVLEGVLRLNQFSSILKFFREQSSSAIYISRLGNTYRASLIHLTIKLSNGTIIKSPQSLVPAGHESVNFTLRLMARGIRDFFKRKVESFLVDYAVITSISAEKSSNIKGVIYSHQFDYDSFLGSVCLVDKSERKYFVFLDEFVPFHPDNINRKVSDCEPDKYYRSINKIFDQIELRFNCNVVIAAHPRSNYVINPFGDRKIEYGNTQNLVFSSMAVLMHASTSVSFAILGGKPIISLISSSYSDYYKQTILEMSSATDSHLLDIDTELLRFLPPVNNRAYQKYIVDYIRHPRAIDQFWMDAVLTRLQSA